MSARSRALRFIVLVGVMSFFADLTGALGELARLTPHPLEDVALAVLFLADARGEQQRYLRKSVQGSRSRLLPALTPSRPGW